MSRYIGKYVSTCDMCLRTKSIRQHPSRELHPLPILDAPWDTASVDFIVELPESNGKDAIMVVVDSVTKWSHFVSTVTTPLAAGTAQLYLHHIWKHHGLPKKVVSDRGPQFVAEFMKEIYRLLGIKLSATTAYHPQGDGQTERLIKSLNSFSASLSTKGRMTGTISSPLWNFSTTTTSTWQLRTFPSSWILAGYLGWDLNQANRNLTWKLSTSLRNGWRAHWRKQKWP